MNTFIRQRGQLLIIYLTTLFMSGSIALGLLATGKSIKELNKSVKTHVVAPSRQQKSLTLLKQWKDEGEIQKKAYKKQRETLLDLIKKHDVNNAAFKAAINSMIKMDKENTKRLLDIQYGLRQHIKPGEWNKIFTKK
ncbi:MAG: hypothetical protein KAJ39_03705 [Gammaproteobacteria bacterium]|nr:hypothetical protein [Gammaproteobacteria bacterium]